MAASDVRNILLRALFEPDFHNRLLANPEDAFKGYNLTDPEKAALSTPGPELYELIRPALSAGPQPTPWPNWILIFALLNISLFNINVQIAPTPSIVYQPLIDAIRASRGQARMELVKTLISELTREQ